jgi:tetratricopeptide (TPR) repeat protein
VGLIALLPGCGGCPRLPEEQYVDGAGLFLAGHHRASARELRLFLLDHGDSPYACDAHYLLGAMALEQGRTREAESHFHSALIAPRNEQMEANAAVGLARCFLRRGEHRQCIAACLDFLGDHPASPRADEALYVLAQGYEGDGQTARARSYYRQVRDRFPSGAWAPKAAARLGGEAPGPTAAPGGRFSVQVGAFAKRSTADEHARLLRGRGYPTLVAPLRAGGRTLHAVRVGPYATRADAQRIAARLKADGFDAIVKP